MQHLKKKITMVVEIPKGQSNKYEYDLITKNITLDRVLYGANVYPGEYGFIDETLDYDGDCLDVISLITYPTLPGCRIVVRVLGIIKMIDDGDIDTKIIGVVDEDPRWSHIQSIDDVPQAYLDEFIDFFKNYKNLQHKKVEIHGIDGIEAAITEIEECTARYEQYKDELLAGHKEKLVEKWRKENTNYNNKNN